MSEKRKFKSDAFEAIHASANALFEVGTINKTTLCEFEEACLFVPDELKPEQIEE